MSFGLVYVIVLIAGVVIFGVWSHYENKRLVRTMPDVAAAIRATPRTEAGQAFGGWVAIAVPVAFVVWLFVPKPPPTAAELMEREYAVQQANQEYAQECQDLLVYWQAGVPLTDDQKEDLQECIRVFGGEQ